MTDTTPDFINEYLRRPLTHRERSAFGIIADLLAEAQKEATKQLFDIQCRRKKLHQELESLQMQKFVAAWNEP